MESTSILCNTALTTKLTPPSWPIPPAIYRPLPRFVKTWLLLDLPFYHFDEHRDGPKAIEEAERKKRERSESA